MLVYPIVVLVTGLLTGFWIFSWRSGSDTHTHTGPISVEHLRKKLPQDLTEWRMNARYITSWNYLRKFLAGHGYKLWSFDHVRPGTLSPPGWDYGMANGFLYTPSGLLSSAQKVGGGPGAVLGLGGLATPRKILWPARHDHGDVVIRVISLGGEGLRSLKILRQIATAPEALIRSNHALPMFREIVLQDIVLGVFPRVTASLADTFEPTTLPFMLERDMLEIFAQCLEALEFLHENLIAHLHVTFSSFLIDSPPLSDSQSRPLTGQCRVYITNFDYAVSFPANTLPVDRFCFGEQFFTSTVDSGSDSKRSQLMLKAPEITDIGHPFSPFPVDCWQFAMSALMLGLDSASKLGEGFFANEAVLELLHTMADDDPTCRPSTLDALTSLQKILCLN